MRWDKAKYSINPVTCGWYQETCKLFLISIPSVCLNFLKLFICVGILSACKSALCTCLGLEDTEVGFSQVSWT